MEPRPASSARSFVQRFFVVVLTAAGASCADPAPLPRVSVSIRGIGVAVAAASAIRSEVTITLCFAHDADANPSRVADAGSGCIAGEVQRAIYWDRNDPFRFEVQLPAGRYGDVRAFATIALLCPAGPEILRVAQGAASAPIDASASMNAMLEIPMVADAEPCR